MFPIPIKPNKRATRGVAVICFVPSESEGWNER